MSASDIIVQGGREVAHTPADVERVWVWGVPLARVDQAGAVDLAERLVLRRQPAYFVLANLHTAMLARHHPRFAAVLRRAAFVLADGMPLVWYSRLGHCPLPERVAGPDLIYGLCCRAAQRGHRVAFLGGAPGTAYAAAREMTRRYPGLAIAAVESPQIDALSPAAHADLICRLRRARADLLLVSLGQPKAELWLDEHCEALGVPACVHVGAAFDFVAGRIARAPRRLQTAGLEWVSRLLAEPRRLGPRYLQNAGFLLQAIARDAADWLAARGLTSRRQSAAS